MLKVAFLIAKVISNTPKIDFKIQNITLKWELIDFIDLTQISSNSFTIDVLEWIIMHFENCTQAENMRGKAEIQVVFK